MAIHYEFLPSTDNVLLVRTWGADESVEDAISYGMGVAQEAIKRKVSKLLVDETELEYSLKDQDLTELAYALGSQSKWLVKIAIVCNRAYLEHGKKYEERAFENGLFVFVTADADLARLWIE